jgi:hypothetical protein
MRDVELPNFFHEVRLLGDGEFSDDVAKAPTRPSIEVFIHASISSKYVMHLHSTAAIAASMLMRSYPEIRYQLTASGVTVLPYLKPGRELASALPGRIHNLPLGIVLTNHGLVVSDDSVAGIESRLFELEKLLWSSIAGFATSKSEGLDDKITPDSASEIIWHMSHNWRVTPDHVVFLGTAPSSELFSLTKFESIEKYILEMTYKLNLSEVQQEQLRWYLRLSRIWQERKEFHTISHDEAELLQNWEPEKIRQEISLGI